MFAPGLDSLVNSSCLLAKPGIKSELSVCLCSYIKKRSIPSYLYFFCFVVDKLYTMTKQEFIIIPSHETSTFYTSSDAKRYKLNANLMIKIQSETKQFGSFKSVT